MTEWISIFSLGRKPKVNWTQSGLPKGPGRPLGHDFQTRNVRRLAVKLPADQSGYAVPFLHLRSLEEPVFRLGDDPVAGAVEGRDRLGPDQGSLIRSFQREVGHVFFFLGPDAAVAAGAGDDAVRNLAAGREVG